MHDPVFKALNLDETDNIPPGVDIEKRRAAGWLSTVQMDRDGEVVLPSAFEKNLDVYKQNPVLFLFHQHKSLPIGKAVNIEVRPEGLWGEFQIAKTSIGDEVLQLLAEGCLRGFSAGFVPIDYEENPSPYKIPQEALKTAMGKKPKKLYREVELVEVSLLGIPSNRGSLVTQAEKGNKVAGLVVKMFDATSPDDLHDVIEQWIRENDTPEYTLKYLLDKSEPLEMKYTLKSLLWEENEHPRDRSGQFARKPDSYEPYKDIWDNKQRIEPTTGLPIRPQDQDRRTEERLDKMIEQQREANRNLEEINDKDSWGNWFKSWAIKIGVAVGAYIAYKKFKKSPAYDEIKKSAKSWLANQLLKGHEVSKHPDVMEFESVLHNLNVIKEFLKKGDELGLSGSPEYKKAEKLYANGIKNVKNIAESGGEKLVGLKGLLNGIVVKEFNKDEHPRSADGKFRGKDSAGVQKRQPGTTDEEIKKVKKEDESNKINLALDHIDEPGAGAAKRRELKLSPQETVRAVMSEYKRGTLRSGSGEVVTDVKQAKAIALSEARKTKELEKTIVTKEMSAEQFEESEHPRDADGKFTDKPGGGTSGVAGPELKPVKPAKPLKHGGARKGSGRLSSDPVAAAEKLKERFKDQNPGATDEEVKGMISQYALDNLKPDLYQYNENPAEYYRKLDEDRQKALLTDYNRPGGENVGRMDSADDAALNFNDSRMTANKWKEEVSKARSVNDAIKTFKDENADKVDLIKAKWLLGIAGASTALGLVSLLAKRKLPGAIHQTPEVLSKNGFIRKITAWGTPEHLYAAPPSTWITWKGLVGEGERFSKVKNIELHELSKTRKLVSGVLRKLGMGEEGKYAYLGTNAVRRLDPDKGYTLAVNDNYVRYKNDADDITGRVIIGGDGEVNLINLAVARFDKTGIPHTKELFESMAKERYISSKGKDLGSRLEHVLNEWGLTGKINSIGEIKYDWKGAAGKAKFLNNGTRPKYGLWELSTTKGKKIVLAGPDGSKIRTISRKESIDKAVTEASKSKPTDIAPVEAAPVPVEAAPVPVEAAPVPVPKRKIKEVQNEIAGINNKIEEANNSIANLKNKKRITTRDETEIRVLGEEISKHNEDLSRLNNEIKEIRSFGKAPKPPKTKKQTRKQTEEEAKKEEAKKEEVTVEEDVRNVDIGVKSDKSSINNVDEVPDDMKFADNYLNPRKNQPTGVHPDAVVVVSNQELPTNLYRQYTSKQKERYGELWTSDPYWANQIIPKISRRILTFASATGVIAPTTALFFEKDIETSLGEVFKKRHEEWLNDQVVAADIKKEEEKTTKQGVSETDKQIKLAKEQARAAQEKQRVEHMRASNIRAMASQFFMDKLKGATSEFTLSDPVLFKKIMLLHGSKIAERMAGADINKEEMQNFLKALEDDPVLLREFAMYVQQFADRYQKFRVPGKTGEAAGKVENPPKSLSEVEEEINAGGRQTLNDQNEIVHVPGSQRTGDVINRKKAGLDDKDLIVKMLEEIDDGVDPELEMIKQKAEINPGLAKELFLDALALEVLDILSNASQSCKDMILNGVPGHTNFEEINKIIEAIFVYLKTVSNSVPKKEETVVKSIDAMSSQSDSGGGLFVGTTQEIKERCPKCEEIASSEFISSCDKPDCPYSFLKAIETKE